VIPTQFEGRVKYSIGEREESHEQASRGETGYVVLCGTSAARKLLLPFVLVLFGTFELAACQIQRTFSLTASPVSQPLSFSMNPRPIALNFALFQS